MNGSPIDRYVGIIREGLDIVRRQSPVARNVPDNLDSPLFGEDGGALQSLDVVTLVNAVEELLFRHHEISVSLVDAAVELRFRNPLASVHVFAEFIAAAVEEGIESQSHPAGLPSRED